MGTVVSLIFKCQGRGSTIDIDNISYCTIVCVYGSLRYIPVP